MRRYWSCPLEHRISYKTDREYEEHFRYLFRQAVKRRLRSELPVLAELSGGIDSSSIVCMADDILSKGEAEAPQLDTLSMFDPTEPEGDERAYIAKIEQKRGREGHHFDRSKYGSIFSLEDRDFVAVPGSVHRAGEIRDALIKFLVDGGYRVVLSGTGGDEFLGGVPNPFPQLADLIVGPQPIEFARLLMQWSSAKKSSWVRLFVQTLSYLLNPTTSAQGSDTASWIDPRFRDAHQQRFQLSVTQAYKGLAPSRRDYAETISAMIRQIAYSPSHALGFEEKRHPFLDQNLIEFLIAIPPSQLLRPGQRRSLMRRALVDIVPSEILWRRTKGFTVRTFIMALRENWSALEKLFDLSLSAGLGYVDEAFLKRRLREAKNGDAHGLIQLLKPICLELWLRALAERGVVNVRRQATTQLCQQQRINLKCQF